MSKPKVIVTGGSGKAGRYIIKEFLDHGYEVLNLDQNVPETSLCPTMVIDLTDAGQVHTALSAHAQGNGKLPVAVVHFAAIPRPFIYPNDVVYRNNVMSTYNILEACANLGIHKVVSASSEAAYGIVFAKKMFDPQYLPLDEEHPMLPEDSYGLSKVIGEETAAAFHRRTGMQVVSFRLGNILTPEDYPRVINSFARPEERLRNIWTYIDARDVSSACRLAVEKSGLGAVALNLSADDTSSDKSNGELISAFFPQVKDIRVPLDGRSSLYANEKCKQLLGWRQQYFLQENAEY